MGSFDEYPPNIRAILEKVADAGYRDILLDEEAGNRFLFDTLASSTDGTLREIGEQLRDGAMDMRQLATSEHYREALNGGIENLLQFDPERLAEDLDKALDEQQETEEAEADSHDDGKADPGGTAAEPKR